MKNKPLLLLPLLIAFFLLSAHKPIETSSAHSGWAISKSTKDPGDDDPGVGSYYRNGSRITYTWDYLGRTFSFWIEFYAGYNQMQATYARSRRDWYEFNGFIWGDPYRNSLRSAADMIKQMAWEEGVAAVDLALSFVQALPYDDRNHHIQRYAVETLIDCRGDCSDTSMLFAGILIELDLNCVFFHIPARNHMAIGLWSTRDGTYVQNYGRKYLFCETTGTGWDIGKCDPQMNNAPIYIYPVYRH